MTKFSPFDGYLVPSDTEWVLNNANNSKLYYKGSVGLPSRSQLMSVYEKSKLACGEGDLKGFVTGDLGFWSTYYYMLMMTVDCEASTANPSVNSNNTPKNSEGGTWYFMTYVHEDFFKENDLNMNNAGEYAKEILRNNFAYEDMTGWNDGNKEALFFGAYDGEGVGIEAVKTACADNKISVKICVNNNGDKVVPKDTCIVAASYDGSAMVDVKFINLDKKIAADSVSDIIDTELTARGTSTDNTVKVMLWNRTICVKPLSNVAIK